MTTPAPPDTGFGSTADASADATDASATVNVDGANAVMSLAEQEAAEIAAVPDPQSPAGQAQILAIIEKYQRLSAGTVDESAAAEQSNGTKAASSGDKNDDDDDSGSSGEDLGSSGLMEILSALLGSGGSSLGSGMGSDAFGQGQQSPFGADPYSQQSTAPASDPFADVPGAAVTPASNYNYNPADDPFATPISTGSGQPVISDAAIDTTDGSADASGDDANADTGGDTGGGDAEPAAADSAGVDAAAFSGAGGSDVPADPGA